MTRPTGFYWISGLDEPEVARWDADMESWALIGSMDAVDDADVIALDDKAIVR